MDGAIERLDCEPCRTVWYRQGGTSTACPGCGAEMTATQEPLVALEIDGPADAGRAAPVEPAR
jgi:hypothetical protein